MLQEADNDLLPITFSDGDKLTLKLRPNGVTIETSRRLARQNKYTQYIAQQIEKREEKIVSGDLSITELRTLMEEIKELEECPENTGFLVDYVMQAACGWTDYWLNTAAKERGEVLPFTRENVSTIDPTRLLEIVQRLNKHFGWSEDEEKKAENSSPLPLPLEVTGSDTRTSMFKEN
jgi:hypothetical protein